MAPVDTLAADSLRGFGSEQLIRFLRTPRGRVAYGVVGSGPPLLLDLGRAHHLEAFWRHPAYRLFVQRLARHFTVVRWDRPGFGLSDRDAPDLSEEGELSQIEHLVRSLDIDGLAVLAGHDSGPIMIDFAARHPDLVSNLALFGTSADGRLLAPSLPPLVLETLTRQESLAIHQVVAATLASGFDARATSWLVRAVEQAAGAQTIRRLLEETTHLDARPSLALLQIPVLVLHRRGDHLVPSAVGRKLAGAIDGASFEVFPGGEHLPFEGDVEPVLRTLIRFLGERESAETALGAELLSARELQVIRMVTQGLTSGQIGYRLGIGRRTVEAHLEHVRLKLGVRSRAQIAAWAASSQLMEVGQVSAS